MLNDQPLEFKTSTDINAQYDDLMRAFEAFKETNDERLDEVERKSGADVVTTNLAVTYLRPVLLTGRFLCEGRVVHRGRTLAHAEAVMTDVAGREVVRATGAFHVRGR